MRSSFRAIALVLGLLLAALPALAQTSTATLTGTVRDSTGAILPAVTVTATNSEKNASQTLISNDDGSYVFPALLPGTYSISAELPGFKKFLRDGITLQVNQTVRIDVELSIGGASETISVTEAAPMVETETSSRG